MQMPDPSMLGGAPGGAPMPPQQAPAMPMPPPPMMPISRTRGKKRGHGTKGMRKTRSHRKRK